MLHWSGTLSTSSGRVGSDLEPFPLLVRNAVKHLLGLSHLIMRHLADKPVLSVKSMNNNKNRTITNPWDTHLPGSLKCVILFFIPLLPQYLDNKSAQVTRWNDFKSTSVMWWEFRGRRKKCGVSVSCYLQAERENLNLNSNLTALELRCKVETSNVFALSIRAGSL